MNSIRPSNWIIINKSDLTIRLKWKLTFYERGKIEAYRLNLHRKDPTIYHFHTIQYLFTTHHHVYDAISVQLQLSFTAHSQAEKKGSLWDCFFFTWRHPSISQCRVLMQKTPLEFYDLLALKIWYQETICKRNRPLQMTVMLLWPS